MKTMRPTKRPEGAARRSRGIVVFAALLVLIPGAAPRGARAQVIQVQGGTSSLYHSTGGSVRVRGEGFDGLIGLGDLETFHVGGLLRKEYRGGLLSVGDQAVPFGLPTDVFQAPHAFFGRGIGYEREVGDTRLRAIGGTTATMYGSPFFLGARSVRGAGILFLDHDVSPTVRVMTRSVFTRRQTVISGLEWRPRSDLRTAMALGGGDGEPYGAASVLFERPWVTARAAWSAAADAFRRVAVPQASASEMERENLDLKIRPIKPLVLQLGRYNFLQPPSDGAPALRGRVHQVVANVKALDATTTLAFYTSRAGEAGNTGLSAGMRRHVGRSVEIGGNVHHARDRGGQRFTTLVATLRENVSPHVDLSQVVTHTEGNTTVSFGGAYLASRFSVGAEWQTVYVPFGSGDPFRQALMVTVRLLAFGNFTANLGSYVAPDGTVKYTLAGNQYLYHGYDAASRAPRASMSDHLVQGLVADEKGNGVRGAAVRVDGDVVYTDSDGYFFVRRPKGRQCAIEVVTEEFLTPLPYVVLSAPETVTAAPEGRGAGVLIVVRAVIPAVPKPQPKDWTGVDH